MLKVKKKPSNKSVDICSNNFSGGSDDADKLVMLEGARRT